jgi:hypothetical protein
MESRVGFDALLPPEMAGRAEDVGVSKSHLGAFPTLSLAVLAQTPCACWHFSDKLHTMSVDSG